MISNSVDAHSQRQSGRAEDRGAQRGRHGGDTEVAGWQNDCLCSRCMGVAADQAQE